MSLIAIDKTFDTPYLNIAFEEAYLDECERGVAGPLLRFWHAQSHFVVMGHSCRVSDDVKESACQSMGVPLLRRSSGGGTVLQGPGALSYALILPIPERGQLSRIDAANRYILERHREVLQPLVDAPLAVQGYSDLTMGGRKVAGNAQRRKKRFFLFHGTFLYHFDLPKISQTLKMPPRRPDYRGDLPHEAFVANMPLDSEAIQRCLMEAWGAQPGECDIPTQAMQQVAEEKLSRPEWIYKFP